MVTIGEAYSPVDGIVYSTDDVKVKIGDRMISPAGALHLTERSVEKGTFTVSITNKKNVRLSVH